MSQRGLFNKTHLLSCCQGTTCRFAPDAVAIFSDVFRACVHGVAAWPKALHGVAIFPDVLRAWPKSVVSVCVCGGLSLSARKSAGPVRRLTTECVLTRQLMCLCRARRRAGRRVAAPLLKKQRDPQTNAMKQRMVLSLLPVSWKDKPVWRCRTPPLCRKSQDFASKTARIFCRCRRCVHRPRHVMHTHILPPVQLLVTHAGFPPDHTCRLPGAAPTARMYATLCLVLLSKFSEKFL